MSIQEQIDATQRVAAEAAAQSRGLADRVTEAQQEQQREQVRHAVGQYAENFNAVVGQLGAAVAGVATAATAELQRQQEQQQAAFRELSPLEKVSKDLAESKPARP